MGSISVFKAENKEELRFFYYFSKKTILKTYISIPSDEHLEDMVLIQEFIEGQEYGMDILNDLNAQYKTTIVKKKLAMRSGETDYAEIVESPELVEVAKCIALKLKHIGNLDIDVLMSKSKVPYIIDMNPRFGGGYPFTHESGNNYVRYLIKNIEGVNCEDDFNWSNEKKIQKYVGCKGIKMYGRFVQ